MEANPNQPTMKLINNLIALTANTVVIGMVGFLAFTAVNGVLTVPDATAVVRYR